MRKFSQRNPTQQGVIQPTPAIVYPAVSKREEWVSSNFISVLIPT